MFFVGVVANAICGGGSMSGCVKLWNLSYQARLASHAGFPGWLYVLMGVEQPHELMTVHLCIRAREKESCHISKDKKKVFSCIFYNWQFVSKRTFIIIYNQNISYI